MNQQERVLRHLRDYGSITSLEAMREYGIMRLASRVSSLKKDGYPIVAERMEVKNRYGEKVYIAKYIMEGTNNE